MLVVLVAVVARKPLVRIFGKNLNLAILGVLVILGLNNYDFALFDIFLPPSLYLYTFICLRISIYREDSYG